MKRWEVMWSDGTTSVIEAENGWIVGFGRDARRNETGAFWSFSVCGRGVIQTVTIDQTEYVRELTEEDCTVIMLRPDVPGRAELEELAEELGILTRIGEMSNKAERRT